ncbi:glycosyltransferase family 2 protein [Prevotella sp. P2-180]|uniref:glycosyltransferase family 2 protein n=1 Tax=Prevotella sp. P2-180 TaxID=2024224 RepID=UPI000B967498|nr:glycosyltransferase family 2 protein [Prevotella sp. P2-180]OYP64832.1 glycosyl transferase family 2 [Prevotella sp. P2-180]
MKLSVVIVNYNVSHYLLQCVDSLSHALRGTDSEVIVVDNHSRDNSVTLLRQYHPEVRIVENLHNLGFAKANNIAIRQSRGEYVLLLNPDTIVSESVVKGVISFLDSHPEAGSAGVRMLNADGTVAPESRRGVPTPMTAFYKLSGLCGMFPNSRRFGRYYLGHLPWDSPQQIEVVSGAFCMLRTSVLKKVGLLDEDYFMYGEDIDLSYRILKSGATNWYVPETILHYKGESTHKSSFRYVHVFYQAMHIFFRKHFSHLGLFISIPIKTAIIVKASSALLLMLTERMRMSLGFARRNNGLTAGPMLFVGSGSMVATCREISNKHGLEATLCICSSLNEVSSYVDRLSDETGKALTVVFDPEKFDYGSMLSFVSDNHMRNISLGVFQPSTSSIITQSEIIR